MATKDGSPERPPGDEARQPADKLSHWMRYPMKDEEGQEAEEGQVRQRQCAGETWEARARLRLRTHLVIASGAVHTDGDEVVEWSRRGQVPRGAASRTGDTLGR